MRNGEMTEGRKEGRERKGCESYAAAAAVVVKVFFGSTRLDGRTVTDLDGRRGGKNFKPAHSLFPATV